MNRLALVMLIGCSAPAPVMAPPKPEPTPSPTPAQTGPSFGETCGANDVCAAGLECVSYYGVAGARGPQFKTCEQRCDDAKPCPTGKQCNTIADGPGRVCR